MKAINQVLHDVYGTGPIAGPYEAITWAAERLLEAGMSVAQVQAQVRKVNQARSRVGKITITFPYGHPLF